MIARNGIKLRFQLGGETLAQSSSNSQPATEKAFHTFDTELVPRLKY